MLAAMERILASEAKARQKAEQLQLTLENMSQGIMLVTNDLKIPVINSRCAELLDLPPDFIKNPPRFDQLAELSRRGRQAAAGADADLHARKRQGRNSPRARSPSPSA